ncbi:glycoside hydrolase family 61 protein [Sistotremastrum niveocremeum HHB9708]|uniref:lytic cellulose monooxygenase (C4-dehydrogenating) n=1 Tax=Sistotremastrum niveocremeum HHB9708 TaxID=1314777 RepID=A0A164WFP5_9AGAM|nr:glycoside hydrolase family 61 protein [Sistotremastrum niveocremeum HHB9708]
MKSFGLILVLCASLASAHYTFPSLVVGGKTSAAWQYVRETNNYNSQAPVTDVTSADFRCYDSATNPTTSTVTIAAGSQLGIECDNTIYHPGVVNVYMAKAPSSVTGWAGDGAVWFKVYQISAVTNGGTSISWPAQNLPGVTFTIPKNLPTGQYLVRIEAIALHTASTYGGAQFYISCGQLNVTGGGSGKPGPLVSIPGVYTGYEPGILININYPIPKNYTQPGPAVWSG